MLSSKVQAIVLAAGRSSRFHTSTSKLSFPLCGQEMIAYPLIALQKLDIPTLLVVGYQKEILEKIVVKRQFTHVACIEQTEQRGTGHALICTKKYWHADSILVMNGDLPLITQEILQTLLAAHEASNATISFIVAENIDPSANQYGRVIQKEAGYAIIEARDFTGDTNAPCTINAGIYLFKRDFLEECINALEEHTNSSELYITDLIELASKQNLGVKIVHAPFDVIRGINTLKELWVAEHIRRSELIEYWMSKGVWFTQAHTVHLDLDVTIGAGTRIDAGVHLTEGTHIGSNVTIGPFTLIKKSVIHDHAKIHSHCIIEEAEIHETASIGPFAHLRNSVTIHKKATVGNFVEMSKSSLGEASKAKHLSYIGNALIGKSVNIGAGTITCNYNGITKNVTTIEDLAQIGSNNSLIAPVTIGTKAMTAAGSVITEDVPAHALGIARARQVNKEDYTQRLQSASFIAATQTKHTRLHEDS